jgi:hypothetical protein
MTDISGIQQAIQKIIEQGVNQAPNATVDKGSAAASDVEGFQAALAQSPAEPQAVNPAANAEAPAKVEGVAEVEETSPGQRILDNLQQTRSGFQDALAEVNQLMAKGTVSPMELFGVTAKLQANTLQLDLTGKIASTGEKNVDTLLKGQ